MTEEPTQVPAALNDPGRPIELLYNVDMAVTVELGRTRMAMRDLLGLRPGKIIELDRSARAPVDILVNNTLLARGEVVVIDEELGVRVTEIAGAPTERQGPAIAERPVA
ncbi:MAG TPA: flagellar motor switch protein FliN [Acidimicrobiales bacterium]|nr:flagellar motor switch protein FliN [Acidimicrobiales bacterium]